MVAKLVNKKMLANHVFWYLMLFYTRCSCCNLQCCGILWLPLTMMQSHCQSEFWVNLMYCESDPGLVDNPTLKSLHGKIWPQLRELPGLADRATLHMIKLKLENIWTGKWVTSPASGPPPPCKQALLAWWYLESFHGLILLFIYMYLCWKGYMCSLHVFADHLCFY